MNEPMENVIKEAISDVDLPLSEIPSIDLYLDQILSLVSEKNEQGADRYKERILTKTMINNYSKEGAILPIKGKKYNRRQILQILFIYSLKNTLSIGEIKRIFDGVFALEEFGDREMGELWSDYLSMKERSRNEVHSLCEEIAQGCDLDLEKDEDYVRLLLSVVSLSSYLKTLAEAMIDARFPIPEEPPKPEKPAKAEKAAKAEKPPKAEKPKKKKKAATEENPSAEAVHEPETGAE